MYSLKSVFAVLSYLLGTATLFWGIVLTQLPWYPRSKYEATGILGSMFGVSAGLLASSWILMRRARVDILLSEPKRIRWTDAVVLCEATLCGLYLLLTVSWIVL